MTYSIVAHDPVQGLMGVAAGASGHGVGRAVTWAMGGVGVVATQADLTPRTGLKALELLRSGELGADEALAAIAEEHENPRGWQMGLLDLEGRSAAHTGDLCLRHAGHVVGRGYSVQANMMAAPNSWCVMAKAFEACAGELSERLLQALRAGHTAGGDVRGDHSAALLIVSTTGSEGERTTDLRVDWSESPIDDLAALVSIDRNYEVYLRALGLLLDGKPEESVALFEKLGDGKPEWTLLRAVALVSAGKRDRAQAIVGQLFEQRPTWREIATRFADTDLRLNYPEVAGLLEAAGEGFPATGEVNP